MLRLNYWVSSVLFSALFIHMGACGNAQEAVPMLGPGAVSPREGTLTSPTVPPLPKKPIEVPIGRLEEDKADKEKAKNSVGEPPGSIQEDPGVRRSKTKQN